MRLVGGRVEEVPRLESRPRWPVGEVTEEEEVEVVVEVVVVVVEETGLEVVVVVGEVEVVVEVRSSC